MDSIFDSKSFGLVKRIVIPANRIGIILVRNNVLTPICRVKLVQFSRTRKDIFRIAFPNFPIAQRTKTIIGNCSVGLIILSRKIIANCFGYNKIRILADFDIYIPRQMIERLALRLCRSRDKNPNDNCQNNNYFFQHRRMSNF